MRLSALIRSIAWLGAVAGASVAAAALLTLLFH
jgi:hypothetical protein